MGRIRRLISSLDLLDLDVEAARRYDKLVYDPASRRSPIGHFDLIIACTALSHEEGMATHYAAHFERVASLGPKAGKSCDQFTMLYPKIQVCLDPLA